MPEPRSYSTLVKPATAEYRDRGSRFLAFANPVQNLESIKALHKALKQEHPKANHHCLAFRLGYDGTQFRASDDGEPSGSAGRPMLGAIDRLGLTNVMLVVVRYFGGTLLGVPGLIQAYGSVAEEALRAGGLLTKWVCAVYELECSYAQLNEVRHLLLRSEAEILHQDLQLFCRLRVAIPLHHAEACVVQLSELRGVQVKPCTEAPDV
ncbi:MAG: YigZ family protein [Bacteroidetes bacterium]|nr:YigZ family protein [Bacteroidota bacterium]MBS1630267.1 YigZ family protein [Bacteroidota bacterium]